MFFFPSLENASGTAIIQPVLQWGPSAAGGGQYWAIASWYVDSAGNAEYSPLTPVSSGDEIDGAMQGVNCDETGACEWTITGRDLTSGASSSLNTLAGRHAYTHAQGAVLEAYGLSACAQYPTDAAVTFSAIDVASGSTTLSPAYTGYVWPVSPSCGFYVDASATSTHTLYFSN